MKDKTSPTRNLTSQHNHGLQKGSPQRQESQQHGRQKCLHSYKVPCTALLSDREAPFSCRLDAAGLALSLWVKRSSNHSGLQEATAAPYQSAGQARGAHCLG